MNIKFNEQILSELAEFDTVSVLMKKAEECIESIEAYLTTSNKIDKYLSENFDDIRHLIWASQDKTDNIIEKIKIISESKDNIKDTQNAIVEQTSNINKRFDLNESRLAELNKFIENIINILNTSTEKQNTLNSQTTDLNKEMHELKKELMTKDII